MKRTVVQYLYIVDLDQVTMMPGKRVPGTLPHDARIGTRSRKSSTRAVHNATCSMPACELSKMFPYQLNILLYHIMVCTSYSVREPRLKDRDVSQDPHSY
jgi:hypothetical protein